MCTLSFGTSAKQQCERNKFKIYGECRHGCVLSFLYLNLSMLVIDSLKLIFPCDVFVGVYDRIQCHFSAEKTTEINESALTIASMIVLQVLRTSFGIHFRESRGVAPPPPPPPRDLPRVVHDGVEPVSNCEHCAVSELPPNRLLNEFISFQVHRGRGFIENKDFTFTEQRTR